MEAVPWFRVERIDAAIGLAADRASEYSSAA